MPTLATVARAAAPTKHCHACEQEVSTAGPWCQLYAPDGRGCVFQPHSDQAARYVLTDLGRAAIGIDA